MNFFNLFSEIETQDPEGYEELNNRRDLLKKFTGKAGKIALTALPFAVGSLFEKSYAGASTSTVLGILNYALTLEYLEHEFYYTALQLPSLIPTGAEYAMLDTIQTHEKEHVAFLQSTIKALGGTPVNSPKFDYTAGSGSGNGPLANVFSDYDTFLAVAQVFEDTGVRAYKGQAPTLVQGGAYLTAALDIHSVEARHASAIRQLRYDRAFATVKPWITLGDPGISSAFNSNYGGEQNTVQAGVQIVDINGFNISDEAASEAFDEPLSSTRVLALIKPFLAQ
jgi:ferritin-like protein